VARSTASEHLTVLVRGGLLAEERQGRHRYLRLADAPTARLVEDLAAAVGEPTRPSSLRTVRAADQLATARTCYDHLAGALGVVLHDALVDAGLLAVRHGLVLTPAGHDWFTELAGSPLQPASTTRPLLRTCLDWTERRHHLGGTAGAVLCTQLLQRSWIARGAQHRAVTVTAAGAPALSDLLGIDTAALAWGPSAAAAASG
jgi:hypothetical protein